MKPPLRFLVTGGAGFIGSHLVDAILARELGEVRVIDNFRRGRRDNVAPHLADPRFELVEGDIRDEATLASACSGIDVVFHLAAQSNVMGAGRDVGYSAATNVLGTVNLLKASQEQGVQRVVFASSREVYGDPCLLPVPESAPFAAKNLYGASKVAGEMYCRAFQNSGLDVRILRLGNVYGPRDTDRVIPIWLERAQNGLDLEVFGGEQVMDLIGVDIVTEAMITAALVDSLPGPINVASGKPTRITELARRILEATGSTSRIAFLPARKEEVVGFVADVGAMQQCLGLTPPSDPLYALTTMVNSRVVV